MIKWKQIGRPGYFGKKKEEFVSEYNRKYGKGNWTLRWIADGYQMDYLASCRFHYEYSYFTYLLMRPEIVDSISLYENVIDNAASNIESRLDYSIQESESTHIQDIAIRNCLHLLGRNFLGLSQERFLVIRGKSSSGAFLNPGVIPFHNPALIEDQSLCPAWAERGSVEDFWQSNKWLVVKEKQDD